MYTFGHWATSFGIYFHSYASFWAWRISKLNTLFDIANTFVCCTTFISWNHLKVFKILTCRRNFEALLQIADFCKCDIVCFEKCSVLSKHVLGVYVDVNQERSLYNLNPTCTNAKRIMQQCGM